MRTFFCTSGRSTSGSGTVLPTETLRQENGETFVYISEESTSWRYETTARRVRVTVLEQNESWTAVSGLSGDAPVVQYATRALNADGGPVRLWEGTA